MFSIGSLCHQALSISIIGSSIHNTVTKIGLEILEFTVSLKVVGRDEKSRLTGGLVSPILDRAEMISARSKIGFLLIWQNFYSPEKETCVELDRYGQ